MSLGNEILESREGPFKSLLENICNKYHCPFQCFRMGFRTEEPGFFQRESVWHFSQIFRGHAWSYVTKFFDFFITFLDKFSKSQKVTYIIS